MKPLKKMTISATDLARNLSATIDKVRMTGQLIEITKGAQSIAQITPINPGGFPISQLSQLLESIPHLTENDKSIMSQHLTELRNNTRLPDSEWE